MIETFAISVAARMKDEVTPGLERIIQSLRVANGEMSKFLAASRNVSRLGVSMGRNLKSAADGAAALGTETGRLTRASHVLDTMVASSGQLARNLAAAKAAGGSMVVGGRGGSGGESYYAGGGSRRGPTDHYGRRYAAYTGAAGLFGVYENSRLQDANLVATATAQVPFPDWIKNADQLRSLEFGYAKKYAFATHGQVQPFAEAILDSSRLLRTLPQAKQRQMLDFAMPYAATEAKMKGIPLNEALNSFVELAHMSGLYNPKEASGAFDAMLQASLTTELGLDKITKAASYVIPSAHAVGADTSEALMMIATMQQAGILNTKSGTWLNNLILNALPNNLGSGLFSNTKQNKALTTLGLYKGGKSLFFKDGHFDVMKEVKILSEAAHKMPKDKFISLVNQAFGKQGARAAALLSEDTTMSNLHSLYSLTHHAQPIESIDKYLSTLSNVGAADQTIANANMTLMNATTTFMGPVNALLNTTSGFFDWTAKTTKNHPVAGGAMDAGLLFGGLLAGRGIWKGSGWLIDKAIEKAGPYLSKAATGALDFAKASGPLAAAIFGIDQAIKAAVTGNSDVYNWYNKFGQWWTGNKDWTLGTSIFDMGHKAYDPNAMPHHANPKLGGAHPSLYHWQHPASAADVQKALQVDVHVDGKKVARAVFDHAGNAASGPMSGASGMNGAAMLPPPNLVGHW